MPQHRPLHKQDDLRRKARYGVKVSACARWTQSNVGFIGAHGPIGSRSDFVAAHPKLRKRRLQETDHPFDITYSKVRMFAERPQNTSHAALGVSIGG